MARFQVDIEKSALGERWTNVYYTEQPDLAAAVSFGQGLVNMEKAIHRTWVLFNTLRVRSTVVGDEVFSIVPLTGTGTVDGATAAALPLFNVVRVDLAATAGRPSRKYYRGILEEPDNAGGALDTARQTAVEAALTAAIEGEQLVDVDGQTIVSAATWPMIAMRQLRRGSRRRTEPILT